MGDIPITGHRPTSREAAERRVSRTFLSNAEREHIGTLLPVRCLHRDIYVAADNKMP